MKYADDVEKELEYSEYMRNKMDLLFDEYIALSKEMSKRILPVVIKSDEREPLL